MKDSEITKAQEKCIEALKAVIEAQDRLIESMCTQTIKYPEAQVTQSERELRDKMKGRGLEWNYFKV